MTTIVSITTTIAAPGVPFEIDDAQLAVVSFLARYSGRTLEAYRHDLRGYFQWAADNNVEVLKATRPHIELFRAWMEARGLAASTIDRRLSTVCGFYRFAHIDGRISGNPAQYVRRPQVHPTHARGVDRSELGVFLFTAEEYAGHCASSGRATSRRRSRSYRVPRAPSTWRWESVAKAPVLGRRDGQRLDRRTALQEAGARAARMPSI